MGINFSKSSHIIFFAGVLPAISWFFSVLFFNIFPNWPNWAEAPSPLLVYGIIYYIFDRYAWKAKVFNNVGITRFPDLSGRWVGKQISSYIEDGKNVELEGALEVRQTFSNISINAYYGKSDSISVVGSFSELNGEIYLFYTFDNDPNTLKQGTMQKHKGSVKIKKLPTEKKLKGFYWNSISNSGDMDYVFDSNELLGRL